MKSKLKHAARLGLALAATVILVTAMAACGTTVTSTVTTTETTTTTVLPSQPTLTSIAVTPKSPDRVAVGATQQFTVIGTYSDSSTKDITTEVSWASSDTAVATISATGLAAGVAEGTTNITATLSDVTSPEVALTVMPVPTLSSIELAPQSLEELTVGATQQLTATGTYSDDSTKDITTEANWTSSDTAVATVSASGLVTAVAEGSAEITASLSGTSSPAVTLTVS
ncbi:MAG: Ig-like domain-containing protein [Dehalococcoidales bacterium]|nr:Ig-like domain-containing protein [Dehalococcoidales bacterium]